MAYETIPPSSSGTCASDPWGDNAAQFAVSKVSTLVNVVFRDTCKTLQESGTALSATIERTAVTGTGANCIVDPTKNGGVLKLTTGTTGSSFRFARNTNGVAAAGLTSELVGNLRTAKYACFVRAALDAPSSTCEFHVCRITQEAANGEVYLGVVGGTSTTNWAIKIGSAAAVDTGVALPAAGVFVTVGIVADGTNVAAWNVDTGVQIGSNLAQSTVNAAAGHWLVFATNTAAVDKAVYVDDVIVITEPGA